MRGCAVIVVLVVAAAMIITGLSQPMGPAAITWVVVGCFGLVYLLVARVMQGRVTTIRHESIRKGPQPGTPSTISDEISSLSRSLQRLEQRVEHLEDERRTRP